MRMKKSFVLGLLLVASASQAIVLPAAFFPTPPFLRENFDTTAVGVYNTLPVFGVPAVMNRIGTGGGLVVRPYPGVNTVPNMLVGDNVDAEIISLIPMRRFGGFFRSGVFGAFSSTATFRFYDVANNPIGTAVVPMTMGFTWVGWQTFPKWRRVEIIGSVPGFQGLVAMDSLRIRPN